MKRFDVELHIEVEADNADAAFADVRTNYCVVNDPNNAVKDNLVDMHVDEHPQELAEDESATDY